jgi:hypothetical protein
MIAVQLHLLCSVDRGYVLYLTYKTILVDDGWTEEVFKVTHAAATLLSTSWQPGNRPASCR